MQFLPLRLPPLPPPPPLLNRLEPAEEDDEDDPLPLPRRLGILLILFRCSCCCCCGCRCCCSFPFLLLVVSDVASSPESPPLCFSSEACAVKPAAVAPLLWREAAPLPPPRNLLPSLGVTDCERAAALLFRDAEENFLACLALESTALRARSTSSFRILAVQLSGWVRKRKRQGDQALAE